MFSAQAEDQQKFDTMTEAAVYGLKRAAALSEFYEYGGQIVQLKGGKYAIAEPSTDYAGDSVSYSADPIHYDGPIVSSYHTHPCLPYTHKPGAFSPADLSGYRAYNRPGYMLDMCTGDVHYWAPGYTVDVALAGDSVSSLAAVTTAVGKIVGHVPVSGKPLETKT